MESVRLCDRRLDSVWMELLLLLLSLFMWLNVNGCY